MNKTAQSNLDIYTTILSGKMVPCKNGVYLIKYRRHAVEWGFLDSFKL